MPKRARKRDKGQPASLMEERRAGTTGPEGPRELEEDREDPRILGFHARNEDERETESGSV